MMDTYTTQQGDMWDEISYKVYGSSAHTAHLMQANTQHLDIFIFPSGIVLQIPPLDETAVSISSFPPWRQ